MSKTIQKKGIDVSYHQGTIDWKKVKNSGIQFAIIRAGYGRTTIDAQFVNNVKGCIKYGIPFGVYWFIYGVNEAEAVQNAELFHEAVAPYKDQITMKVWCDLEYDTDKNAIKRGVSLTKAVRTSMVIAFCERMKGYGYEVGNYANPDYLKNKFNDLSQYPLWLAKYSSSKGNYDCEIWQYSSKGKVDGIKGNVDMNYLYIVEEDNKSIEEIAEEVIAGKWGTGSARKKALEKAGYNYSEVQAKVNEILQPVYYPMYTGNSIFIDVVLKAIGVPGDMRGSYKKRGPIAKTNGIANYKGNLSQNRAIISLAKQGKLKRP